MEVLKNLNRDQGIFSVKLTNFNGKCFHYDIMQHNDNQWPITFDTATKPMNDFIGNITNIDGELCSVRGYFLGQMRDVNNVRIIDPNVSRNGQRIMVSDHISVNGRYELVASVKRLIDGKFAEVNFTNIGWSDEHKCEYLRIDVHTGEFIRISEDRPNYSNFV